MEAVAGALGWDFIEITPAQFLDEGVDRVSAHADEIFRSVMELNRCVILLDEIDELVRRRGNESEPLERFFTTTMLPRLAKLWELGRVVFFANTNGIADVDSAIRRSQRFDTLMLVLPPGYGAKEAELARRGLKISVTEEFVNDILMKDRSTQVSRPTILGWYGLLRYDQMQPLATRLHAHLGTGVSQVVAVPGGTPVSEVPLVEVGDEVLADNLQALTRDLSQLDWEGRQQTASEPPDLRTDSAFERRDSRVQMTARLGEGVVPPAGWPSVASGDVTYLPLVPGQSEDPGSWLGEYGLLLRDDGVVVVAPPA